MLSALSGSPEYIAFSLEVTVPSSLEAWQQMAGPIPSFNKEPVEQGNYSMEQCPSFVKVSLRIVDEDTTQSHTPWSPPSTGEERDLWGSPSASRPHLRVHAFSMHGPELAQVGPASCFQSSPAASKAALSPRTCSVFQHVRTWVQISAAALW